MSDMDCRPFFAAVAQQPPDALVAVVGSCRAALQREFLPSLPTRLDWVFHDAGSGKVLGRRALLLDASNPHCEHQLRGCDISVLFIDDAVYGVEFWDLMRSRLRPPGAVALTWSGVVPWKDAPTDAT